MKGIQFTLGSLLFVAFFASDSMAQVQRTFVSGLGSDGNSCGRTDPCRTFNRAVSQTNPAGEVVVLDSAGYGAFSIGQSVSIIAPPGVYGGISVFSGDGIDVNAGISDTVILRGLTVNNHGSSGSGIVFNTGGTLHVESCVVNGFSNVPGVSFNGAGTLEVKDSIMRGNFSGIVVSPSSGTAVATIEQVRLEANTGPGLIADPGSQVTVRNSIASANSIGLGAISTTVSSAELNIENCVASNNNIGILARKTSTGAVTVRVSNSTVTDNAFGLTTIGTASLLSRSNNTVEGNGTDGIFTGTYPAK